MSNLIPLSVPSFRGQELAYVTQCIETTWVSSGGPFVTAFEKGLRDYVGAAHAVACSSGTAALHVALQLVGVQPGDEVIVPTVTFVATINAVRYCGAEPVFMDCDDTLNIDVAKVQQFCEEECVLQDGRLVNRQSGRRIAALLPVHIFGHPVEMAALMTTARQFGLKVVEDATESLGSSYTAGPYQGKNTGTIGDIGCFSFNGNKIITTGGGGMLVTDDAVTAQRAQYLTTQAKDDPIRFIHHDVGYNYRLSNLHAAVGVAQLETLDDAIARKRENFQIYREALQGHKGLRFIDEPVGTFSNYWHYALVVDSAAYGRSAEALWQALEAQQIQTRPLWQLNHCQRPYQNCQAYRIEKAPGYHERVLNIPCSVGLTAEERSRVIQAIRA